MDNYQWIGMEKGYATIYWNPNKHKAKKSLFVGISTPTLGSGVLRK